MGTDYPVHADVTVHSGKTIYRTDDWWKAAVVHSYDGGEPEIAIYLWHRDDDWSQKNKYHVKTTDAWQADKKLIEEFLSGGGSTVSDQSSFPVSDYYRVSHGESVFQTDGWWKAIVTIDQKGSYETQEVIIYLWQKDDGDWRRRQKYAIKNRDDWSTDRDAVDALLTEDAEQVADMADEVPTNKETNTIASDTPSSESDADILADLEAEVKELHLGSGVDDN